MASAEIIFTALPNSMNNEARGFLIGASLSEPHIDEFAVEFVYIYVYTSECKSLWGEPERVHRISAVTSVQFRGWVVAAELNDEQPLAVMEGVDGTDD